VITLAKKTDDVEPAEVAAIEETTLTFDPDPFNARGDARDVMLGILRSSMDWGKLSEQQQRDINAAVDQAASGIIRKLVKAISAEGRPVVVAKLVSIAVKDEIKAVLTAGFTHESLAMLGDAAGQTVQIVVADASKYDHQRSPAQVDPDQPELPVDGDGDLVDAADGEAQDDQSSTVKDVEIQDA
jgi:hypothetical protein